MQCMRAIRQHARSAAMRYVAQPSPSTPMAGERRKKYFSFRRLPGPSRSDSEVRGHPPHGSKRSSSMRVAGHSRRHSTRRSTFVRGNRDDDSHVLPRVDHTRIEQHSDTSIAMRGGTRGEWHCLAGIARMAPPKVVATTAPCGSKRVLRWIGERRGHLQLLLRCRCAVHPWTLKGRAVGAPFGRSLPPPDRRRISGLRSRSARRRHPDRATLPGLRRGCPA